MFKLYPQQEIATTNLKHKISVVNMQLLLGEVGAGKTYVIAGLLKESSYKTLIAVEKHLVNKWEDVLSQADVDPTTYKIVVQENKEDLIEYDLVVVDEIHRLSIARLKNLAENSNKVIGLTGTIVDKNVKDITNIVKYFECIDDVKYIKNKYQYDVYDYCKKYIKDFFSVTLERKHIDVDKITINTIKENIEMTREEQLFYNFALKRITALGVSELRKRKTLADLLDKVPNAKNYVVKNHFQYYIGEKITDTVNDKLNRLKTILDTRKNENFLIYTFKDELAFNLSEELNIKFVDTRNENCADTINKELEKGENVVINIQHILTGVDLKADRIIFYQTPMSLVHDTQAVGRITRLNSSFDDKEVIYLYHNNTIQEKMVNEIEKNRQLNNTMIDKKEDEKEDTKEMFGAHEVISFNNCFIENGINFW